MGKEKNDKDTVFATTEEYERYSFWARTASKFIDRNLPYETKLKLYWDIRDSDKYTWPVEFPINSIKPTYWEELTENKRREYMDAFLEVIEGCLGEKGLYRYYYQKICNYTDQQFEDWWKSQRN